MSNWVLEAVGYREARHPRDRRGRWRHTLYHATAAASVSSIERQGLRPVSPGGAYGEADAPAVYLSPDPDLATEWGDVVYAVDVDGLKLERDESSLGGWRALESIPPRRLKRLDVSYDQARWDAAYARFARMKDPYHPLDEADFVPSLHPRDRRGRFAETLAGLDSAVGPSFESPLEWAVRELAPNRPRSNPPVRPVAVGDDVERAAALLAQGTPVELNQPREAATLLDRLAEHVRAARAHGGKAPDFDLCKVSVKGTNLFCTQSKGVPRVRMPQLSGIPAPGSKASRLPKDSAGYADVSGQFVRYLRGRGVQVRDRTEKAEFLRATQNQLDGAKVAAILSSMERGEPQPWDSDRLFVSRDNYIVDGHHRWAAKVAFDLEDNRPGDISMPVAQIDMGIVELLAEASRFARSWGIGPRGLTEAGVSGSGGGTIGRMREEVEEAVAAAFAGAAEGGYDFPTDLTFDPKLHPRDRVGRFVDVLSGLGHDQAVTLPNGTWVYRGLLGRIEVKDRDGRKLKSGKRGDIEQLARAALKADAGRAAPSGSTPEERLRAAKQIERDASARERRLGPNDRSRHDRDLAARLRASGLGHQDRLSYGPRHSPYGFGDLEDDSLSELIGQYRKGLADMESGRSNYAAGGSHRQVSGWLKKAEAEATRRKRATNVTEGEMTDNPFLEALQETPYFNPRLHPRGRAGRFIDVLGGLKEPKSKLVDPRELMRQEDQGWVDAMKKLGVKDPHLPPPNRPHYSTMRDELSDPFPHGRRLREPESQIGSDLWRSQLGALGVPEDAIRSFRAPPPGGKGGAVGPRTGMGKVQAKFTGAARGRPRVSRKPGGRDEPVPRGRGFKFGQVPDSLEMHDLDTLLDDVSVKRRSAFAPKRPDSLESYDLDRRLALEREYKRNAFAPERLRRGSGGHGLFAGSPERPGD